MYYTETLDWILDKKGAERLWSPEEAQQNIDFVHSLGLICDSVGWSRLDLASARAPEILAAIENFCRKNGWSARGFYRREYAQAESEWYALRTPVPKDGFYVRCREVLAQQGGTVKIDRLCAYKDTDVSPKWGRDRVLVPDKFRRACLELGINGIDFCWAPDTGKYAAMQYFHLYAQHSVSHLSPDELGWNWTVCNGLKNLPHLLYQKRRIGLLGGALPRLCRIFDQLTICLPPCYLADDLPEKGFAGSFRMFSHGSTGIYTILIHRQTTALLLQRKAIQPAMLQPVPVLDRFPAGYGEIKAGCCKVPAKDVREELLRQYKQLQQTGRPLRRVSEKEALSALRKAKRARKTEFHKALAKATVGQLEQTAYAPMAAYYLIADGGQLSDEYFLYAYQKAVQETACFQDTLAREELLQQKPNGVVIAGCTNGDFVLLCPDGSAARISHEYPETVESWPSLAQFILESLQANGE